MASKRKVTFSDDLRQRIHDSELSLGQLAAASGVAKKTLSRFARGLRGMLVPSIDALVDALGLLLVERPKRPRKQGRRKSGQA